MPCKPQLTDSSFLLLHYPNFSPAVMKKESWNVMKLVTNVFVCIKLTKPIFNKVKIYDKLK